MYDLEQDMQVLHLPRREDYKLNKYNTFWLILMNLMIEYFKLQVKHSFYKI